MAINQFVTFMLADEKYAMDIMKIDEIIRMMEITPIPKADYFIEGVINLRGKVIPVVDLRKKFGLMETDHTKATRIIVVNIRDKKIGVIVDSVDEVMRIDDENIEEAPAVSSGIDSNYITGVAKTDKGMIIIIDIEKVFTEEETNSLSMF